MSFANKTHLKQTWKNSSPQQLPNNVCELSSSASHPCPHESGCQDALTKPAQEKRSSDSHKGHGLKISLTAREECAAASWVSLVSLQGLVVRRLKRQTIVQRKATLVWHVCNTCLSLKMLWYVFFLVILHERLELPWASLDICDSLGYMSN